MTQQLALLHRPHTEAPGPGPALSERSALSDDIAVILPPLMPQNCQEKDPVLTCLECDTPLTFHRHSKQFCGNTCCQRFRRRERARPVGLPDLPALHYGRFEDYQARYTGLIDCIIVDPPYAREFLQLYAALAQFALATLVPGGHLLCLTGWGIAHEVETMFRAADLEFLYGIAYVMPGATSSTPKWTSTGKRMINQQTKPILWYQKRGTRSRGEHRKVGSSGLIGNNIRAKNTQNRAEFKWQQDLPAFQHLLYVYTNKYDVICDPCMGSGTTLVAALTKGRCRVIGIDCNREAYSQAVGRVQAVQQGGETGAAGAGSRTITTPAAVPLKG